VKPLELATASAVLTWLLPYIGALVALVAKGKARDYTCAGVLLVSALFSTVLWRSVIAGGEPVVFKKPWIEALGLEINLGVYVDSLAAYMGLVVAWLCFLIGFYSLKYMEGDPGLTRYWFFFDFFVGSMLLLVYAENLITMFLGWEGTGLASYALIGHWYTDEEERWVGDPGRKALGVPMWFPPSHSGVRAIVFTRLGDVGFIAGIAVLYALTGTFSIPELAEHPEYWALPLAARGLLYPFLLVFSLGALAKSAQFPFHEWLVTAMTGPTSVSALIHAATMVKAGVFFMLRFAPIFVAAAHIPEAAPAVHSFFATIALIGGFTAFFMATQATVARELKLILAFSTASQLGYMFLAIGSSGLLHEFVSGFAACFNHLMSHAVFKASLFLAAGAVIHAVHSRFIDDMGALSKYMKLTFIAMLLAALSLSGVPPFMGFWTKDSVVEAAKHAHLALPTAFGAVTSLLTAFYSMRMLCIVFLGRESKNVEHALEEHKLHEAHPIMLAPYLLLALVSIGLGIAWPLAYPALMKTLTHSVIGLEEVPHEFHLHIDVQLTATCSTLVAAGLLLAIANYFKPALRLDSALLKQPPLKALREFLYDRWLLNSVYYKIFVYGGAAFARAAFKWFDTLVVDGLYHRLIPWLTMWFSREAFKNFETPVIDEGYHSKIPHAFIKAGSVFRRAQTGRINHYLLTFFTGLVIVAILVLWVI